MWIGGYKKRGRSPGEGEERPRCCPRAVRMAPPDLASILCLHDRIRGENCTKVQSLQFDETQRGFVPHRSALEAEFLYSLNLH